ncbi:abortive infection protein [Candidatus Vecturithrix granuli]|uniref:Abortive infection protein n=1 Tax=Vecturithrix granuli TaxID=1499967 RepID=A0A081C9S6_VECG1|nr:abortive infection protein [Candidatus Vecturithrix granuli]
MIYPEDLPQTHLPAMPTTPTLKETLWMYVFSSILLVTLGSLVQHLHLLSGLVISELGFVIAPVLLFTCSRQYHVKRTFYLTAIRVKTALLAMLVSSAAFILVGIIAALQEMIFPRSQDYQEIWDAILTQFHQIPLAATLLLISLLPGVCEELLFRGFLLHGLRKKLSNASAIIIVGILFGAFHLDPYRFLPVTLLGVLFGYMVVRTGSILTGMVAHSTNNAIAMLISYAVFRVQSQGISIPDPPTSAEQLYAPEALLALLPIIGIALLVFVLGLRALPHLQPVLEEPGQDQNQDIPSLSFEIDEIMETEEENSDESTESL